MPAPRGPAVWVERCNVCYLMLWTAPPPARRCQGRRWDVSSWHFSDIPGRCDDVRLSGEDRKWLAHRQTEANDPSETSRFVRKPWVGLPQPHLIVPQTLPDCQLRRYILRSRTWGGREAAGFGRMM